MTTMAASVSSTSTSTCPSRRRRRPDAGGDFICGDCYHVFKYSAILDSHWDRYHSTNYTCFVCSPSGTRIPGEKIKEHMVRAHGHITSFNGVAFYPTNLQVCTCCAIVFPNVFELRTHMKSMAANGWMGPETMVAKGDHHIGSLSQKRILLSPEFQDHLVLKMCEGLEKDQPIDLYAYLFGKIRDAEATDLASSNQKRAEITKETQPLERNLSF